MLLQSWADVSGQFLFSSSSSRRISSCWYDIWMDQLKLQVRTMRVVQLQVAPVYVRNVFGNLDNLQKFMFYGHLLG